MKTNKLIVITIMLFTLAIVACSCNNLSHKEEVDVDVKITYSGEAESDMVAYYNCVAQEALEGRKVIAFSCEFTNNENYEINMLNIDNVSNSNFVIRSEGCLEWEPTYPIPAGETISCNLYAFVDESMTDEQITEELKNTTFTFSCCDVPEKGYGHLHYFSAKEVSVDGSLSHR